jgi:hypothetical protein
MGAEVYAMDVGVALLDFGVGFDATVSTIAVWLVLAIGVNYAF